LFLKKLENATNFF
jgi:carboxylesterase type B